MVESVEVDDVPTRLVLQILKEKSKNKHATLYYIYMCYYDRLDSQNHMVLSHLNIWSLGISCVYILYIVAMVNTIYLQAEKPAVVYCHGSQSFACPAGCLVGFLCCHGWVLMLPYIYIYIYKKKSYNTYRDPFAFNDLRTNLAGLNSKGFYNQSSISFMSSNSSSSTFLASSINCSAPSCKVLQLHWRELCTVPTGLILKDILSFPQG